MCGSRECFRDVQPVNGAWWRHGECCDSRDRANVVPRGSGELACMGRSRPPYTRTTEMTASFYVVAVSELVLAAVRAAHDYCSIFDLCCPSAAHKVRLLSLPDLERESGPTGCGGRQQRKINSMPPHSSRCPRLIARDDGHTPMLPRR